MFSYTTPVRFADVDHAGIVYYPRFFDYFHIAFEELWRARMGPRAYTELIDKDRVGFPAVRAECNFLAPLRFGDDVVIDVTILRPEGSAPRGPFDGKSITFHYRISRGGEPRIPCADGRVTCAVVDLARFAAVPVPARVIDMLRDLVEP
jgi:4-hydroxybenzoyl-CoA thioesterase